MHNKTPYDKLKGTALWDVLDKSLNKLIQNHDLLEKTKHDYIVGFLCAEVNKLAKKQ